MTVCKMAVETCFWPLFEVENGVWKLSYRPKNKLPIEEFLKLQGRFRHLFKPGNEALIARSRRMLREVGPAAEKMRRRAVTANRILPNRFPMEKKGQAFAWPFCSIMGKR